MHPQSGESTRYRWFFQAGAAITGAAVQADGVAYIGCHDGRVYALNLDNGDKVASSEALGGKIEGGVALATLRGRRTALVPCSNGALYLLDATSLAQEHAIRLGGRLRSTPLVHHNTAYVSSDDGFVAAVNLHTGKEAGRWRLAAGARGAPAILGSLLLCGCRNGTLSAFALGDEGSPPLWTVQTRHQVLATPVVDKARRVAFFGSLDGCVYAVDDAGRLAWPPRQLDGQIMAGPTLDEGKLYAGTTSGALHALDAQSGRLVWPEPAHTGDWIAAAPALWRGLVFAGCNDGHLYVMDAASGKQLWRFPAEARVQAQPALTPDGDVIVGAENGAIYCLPWHLQNHYQAAKWLDSQPDRQREAGERWLKAGDQERAFARLHEAGAWLRLAEAAEGAGRYAEAAHAYEQQAEASSGTAESQAVYWQQAATAWEQARCPQDALRCRKVRARMLRLPLLVLTPEPAPDVTIEEHLPLTVRLSNEGVAEACSIIVHLRGHVRLPLDLPVEPLAAHSQRSETFADVEPAQSGAAEVRFDVDYHDGLGRAQETAHATLRLQVRPAQATVVNIASQHIDRRVSTGGGDYVGSDKVVSGDEVRGDRVGGDKISAGDVQGDGIAIGRSARASVSFAEGETELDRAFAPLMAALSAAPDNARRSALQAADALKAEAAKGTAADDTRLATLIDDLARLAPDAAGAVAALFSSQPLAALAGNVTRFVLNKIQSA